MNIYLHENLKIAWVYESMGLKEEAKELLKSFKLFAENDKSIYKHAFLSGYYSYMGNINESLAELKLFAEQDNYHYWIILFFEIDPAMQNVKDNPEFHKLFKQIEHKFWIKHEQIKLMLQKQDLL